MTFRTLIQTRILGKPVIERAGDALRLEGHYPNPEKGTRFFAAVMIMASITIISAPALYYGAPASQAQSLGELPGVILGGIPAALAPLIEVARTWTPGESLPDLQGWGFGLGLALIILMFGSLTGHLWCDLTDRPYLAVELRGGTLSIQRGMAGIPIELPCHECCAVHVGRRRSGAHDVLIQHGGTLTPVAIVKGNERHALLLKAKIDALIAGNESVLNITLVTRPGSLTVVPSV